MNTSEVKSTGSSQKAHLVQYPTLNSGQVSDLQEGNVFQLPLAKIISSTLISTQHKSDLNLLIQTNSVVVFSALTSAERIT